MNKNYKDLTGEKFGFVEVVGMIQDPKNKLYLAKCFCHNCNKETICAPANLRKKISDYCAKCISANRKRKPVLTDITGQKFGLLKVIRMEQKIGKKNGMYYAICECCCGTKNHPVVPAALKKGFTTSCGCRKDHYSRNTGENSVHFKGHKEIRGRTWSKWKENATRRGLDFNLDIQDVWNLYVKQNRKCALSGIDIIFGKSQGGTTASIDRKNISLGYEIQNIQLVHKHVNTMRNVFEIDYFLDVCRKITEYNKCI